LRVKLKYEILLVNHRVSAGPWDAHNHFLTYSSAAAIPVPAPVNPIKHPGPVYILYHREPADPVHTS
jgi:hypothetical protein